MEAFKTPQPPEEEVVSSKKPSLSQRVKSILKQGASATAGLIVGANLDRMSLPSFNTPSNENNNRPVPEAVENTLSEAQKKEEAIADKRVWVSKNQDLQYYKDSIEVITSELFFQSQPKGNHLETVDMERYKRGLMIRAVQLLLLQGFNVSETDQIEIHVYQGVPYEILYGETLVRSHEYVGEITGTEQSTSRHARIDDNPAGHSTLIVSPEVITSAFKDLDNPSS